MKIHMTVNFENEGLDASTSRYYEFDDIMTLEDLMNVLRTEADLAMLDFCDDEEEEEQDLIGTKISIEEMW